MSENLLNTECKNCKFNLTYFKYSKTQLYCKICGQKIGKTTGGTYYVG